MNFSYDHVASNNVKDNSRRKHLLNNCKGEGGISAMLKSSIAKLFVNLLHLHENLFNITGINLTAIDKIKWYINYYRKGVQAIFCMTSIFMVFR